MLFIYPGLLDTQSRNLSLLGYSLDQDLEMRHARMVHMAVKDLVILFTPLFWKILEAGEEQWFM